MKVKAIAEHVSPVTPYLSVKNAAEAIEYYKRVFGATEVMRLRMPDERIGHAEIRIGGGLIMLADEYPEMGILSPKSLGESRSPVMIHLYVENIDVVYKRARGRRRLAESTGGPVLRRSQRAGEGPLRPRLGHFHAQRGRVARGDAEAPRRDDEAAEPIRLSVP
jgi:catechol 2,3-dioxygenase-like lactoylglutathione lyase family enzyme